MNTPSYNIAVCPECNEGVPEEELEDSHDEVCFRCQRELDKMEELD